MLVTPATIHSFTINPPQPASQRNKMTKVPKPFLATSSDDAITRETETLTEKPTKEKNTQGRGQTDGHAAHP